jgi:hypothetical protein
MSERIFLRLGDRLALGADDLQWILYKSSRKKSGGLNWAPISFVSSTKTILERCIRESGLDDDTAASAFESLHPTFALHLRSPWPARGVKGPSGK